MKVENGIVTLDAQDARLYPGLDVSFPVEYAAALAARMSQTIELHIQAAAQKNAEMAAAGYTGSDRYIPVGLPSRMDVRDALVEIAANHFILEELQDL